MSPERSSQPAPKRPYELFGFTEQESLFGRVSRERFEAIINDDQTTVHAVQPSSNDFGEFLFVTTSRPGRKDRIAMTFYGLGYHEHRERWITEEWFWYQSETSSKVMGKKIGKEQAKELLQQHLDSIIPQSQKNTQTRRGQLFDILADLTDEDGALAEMEDIESLNEWLFELEQKAPLEEPPPRGDNLLDQVSIDKLPPLYSGEEKGLDALAQVKFFTPDSNWAWYASEFDGEDILFGLVSGFEVECGYFSLKELQEVRGPLGLQIERDLHFEPKKLGELLEWHRQQRRTES